MRVWEDGHELNRAGALNIEGEQLSLLLELLESAQARMLVGIRHADHRIFRGELRRRLTLVEQIIERCPHVPMPAPAP